MADSVWRPRTDTAVRSETAARVAITVAVCISRLSRSLLHVLVTFPFIQPLMRSDIISIYDLFSPLLPAHLASKQSALALASTALPPCSTLSPLSA
jgi:hypothetical protein